MTSVNYTEITETEFRFVSGRSNILCPFEEKTIWGIRETDTVCALYLIEERGIFQLNDHFTKSDSLEFDYQKTSYFDPGGGCA